MSGPLRYVARKRRVRGPREGSGRWRPRTARSNQVGLSTTAKAHEYTTARLSARYSDLWAVSAHRRGITYRVTCSAVPRSPPPSFHGSVRRTHQLRGSDRLQQSGCSAKHSAFYSTDDGYRREIPACSADQLGQPRKAVCTSCDLAVDRPLIPLDGSDLGGVSRQCVVSHQLRGLSARSAAKPSALRPGAYVAHTSAVSRSSWRVAHLATASANFPARRHKVKTGCQQLRGFLVA